MIVGYMSASDDVQNLRDAMDSRLMCDLSLWFDKQYRRRKSDEEYRELNRRSDEMIAARIKRAVREELERNRDLIERAFDEALGRRRHASMNRPSMGE